MFRDPPFIGLILCITAYISYADAFFRSPEFSEVEPVWSLDEYEEFVEAMRQGQPQVTLEGWTRYCSTDLIVINGVSSTDASDFPNVSAVLDLMPVIVLRPTVHVELDPDSANLLNESVAMINICEPSPSRSITVTQKESMVGWKEKALITRDGELPESIGRARGIVAGIFWSELYHAFKVDAIPSLGASITKNNTLIDAPTVLCGDLDWSCTWF